MDARRSNGELNLSEVWICKARSSNGGKSGSVSVEMSPSMSKGLVAARSFRDCLYKDLLFSPSLSTPHSLFAALISIPSHKPPPAYPSHGVLKPLSYLSIFQFIIELHQETNRQNDHPYSPH